MCAIGSSQTTSVGGSAPTTTLMGTQAASSETTLTPGARRANAGIRGTVLTGGSGMTQGPGAPVGGGGGGRGGPNPIAQF